MGHTHTHLLVHVVFSTKGRAQLISDNLRPQLYRYLVGVAREEFGHIVQIGGTSDHLHALIALRTDVSLADAMRKWKSLSSGWVHKTYPAHPSFAWQTGYAAFSVSQSNVHAVRRYIAQQRQHHRAMSFDEELRAFLERHGISYDARDMQA
jgi:REP element-mobilizing transposase RayT